VPSANIGTPDANVTGRPVPLLRVEHLRTVFPLADGNELAAVDDVSLEIGHSRTVGLIGESGSGKSLTGLSIVQLVPPPGRIAGGRVELDGRDLLSMPARDLQHIRGGSIGVIFQEPSAALNPVLTIGYQIAETMAAHGLARGRVARERAIELLARVRMPDPRRRAAEYAHQLSGGLRQRAMIAVAIAAGPQLLIADEPTTALDATVQAEILDLLRDLQTSMALSLLLISHDFGVIGELADRVIVMRSGRVVEEGPTARIFGFPTSPYTKQLLDAADLPGMGRSRSGLA
jgi:ABC-type dipeptide/oligopeptide/nickel transport system ATPase component